MELFRDVAISIFAIVAVASMVILSIVALSLSRRARIIQESIMSASASIRKFADIGSGAIKPLGQISAVFTGATRAIELVNHFFPKNKTDGGGKDNEQG